MRFQETETVELKSIVMDDIKKEIIAFANCDGGTVYVGVSDDGTVLGLRMWKTGIFLPKLISMQG